MATDVLLATSWTSAGDVLPNQSEPRSRLSLRERVEAASEAGFRGFGIYFLDLIEAERQYGLSGIHTLLVDNGMEHVELEGIPDWWVSDGPVAESSEEVRRRMLVAAEALGARHIKVTPDERDRVWDLEIWAARFAVLAAQAEDRGARLGIEFVPWSNIKNLQDGVRLVERAGHDNGGLVIDIWHLERAGTPPADLLDVPRARITGVELNDADADAVGSLLEDTINRRRYCGEGTFDLGGVLAALREVGWTGPWGVEIISVEHRARPLRDALRKAFLTARAQLDPMG